MHRTDSSPGDRRPRLAWARRTALALLVALVPLGPARPVLADARSDYLVRLLRTSTTFRVRAQAALSLGRVDPEPEVVAALTAALDDENASVRTAAASSLASLEDPSALPALQAHRRDRDRTVRRTVASTIRKLEAIASRRDAAERRAQPRARYYVGVGLPGSRVDGVDEALRRELQGWLRERIGGMAGVALAPDGEQPAAAQRVLRSRRLTGFFVDSSIVAIRTTEVGTRAEVSLVINSYPGRNVRAMLSGAATVQGASASPASRAQAIRGAMTGALRRLPQALEQSGSNGG